MGKRRRSRARKTLPPAADRRKRAATVHLDSMDCPNHAASFDLPNPIGKAEPYQPRFPLMKLMWSEGNCGQPDSLLFVDSSYGISHWADRDQDCPPSWMDPEIFVREVLSDPRTREIFEEYKKRKTAGRRQKLVDLLSELFEERYLVYVLAQFERAAPVLAEWIVAHLATQDATKTKVRQRRRKSST